MNAFCWCDSKSAQQTWPTSTIFVIVPLLTQLHLHLAILHLQLCRSHLWSHPTCWRYTNKIIIIIIRPPGTAVPDGLIFYPWCYLFFFIFSPLVLRGPSTDRPETLPHNRNLAEFYNPTPKIRGALPPKLGAKNMQNFGQFWTTSDFHREYLRNGWRYPKSADVTNYIFIMKIVHEVQETKKSAKRCKVLVCAQANNELLAIPPAFNERSPVNFGPLTAWK